MIAAEYQPLCLTKTIMKNQTILALDTATEACSVALWHNGNLFHFDEISPRTHTQRILPMIDDLLAQSGITLKQIDVLAFGRGPGSFTGVRVGISVAQGIAFGANLPVAAISNLTAMAEAARLQSGATEVVALIDARMNEVYFSQLRYQNGEWQEVVAEQVCSPEKAIEQIQLCENLTVVGTGWAAYSQFSAANLPLTISEIILPSAQAMISLVQNNENTPLQNAMTIEPVYLRNDVAWQKLPHKM